MVGSPPNQRGVVSAASYEARTFGIHSAMPSVEAGKRCPHAVFLPVDMPRYKEASETILRILERFTPLIEPLSIDEAFLDVTGAIRLFGEGPEIGRQIKEAIQAETQLTASVGVASNKFLAKLASDLEKPDGLTVVPRTPDKIRAFLAPLPAERIWGVGKVTRLHLSKAGIVTIGDIQRVRLDTLASLVGRHSAHHLKQLAMGEDAREIEMNVEEQSISREFTFMEDCADREELEAILCDLVDDVGRRLRRVEKYASTAHIKVRWTGFETITRQMKLDPPCCDDFQLRKAAMELFGKVELTKPVRLIGFGVTQLHRKVEQQLLLFHDGVPPERAEKLSRTVDQIRSTFGPDSIHSGRGRRL